MKIRSLLLATAFVLTAGAALAQSDMTGTPTGQAGSKESATSNTTMSKDTMANDKMKKDHATTGTAVKGENDKNVSPASPDVGIKQVK
jgi:pentapeptide MXKDX repeat protein